MSNLTWSEIIAEAKTSSGGGGNYEPLPDGEYELKVVDAELKTTQTGKPMFKLKTEVQSGPYAKRLVWDNLTLSFENPTALRIVLDKFGALGLGEAYFNQEPTNEAVAAATVGRSFRGQLGTREYNNKKSNEIKRYLPAVGAVVAGASAPSAPAVAPAPAPAPAPAAAVAPAPPAPPAVPAAAPAAEAAPPAPPF